MIRRRFDKAESRALSKKNKRNHFQNKANHFNRFRIGKYNNNFSPKTPTTTSLINLQFNLDHKHTFRHQSARRLHHTGKVSYHGYTQDFQPQRIYALDAENQDTEETSTQSETFLSKSQEAVKVKYSYNFNSLDIVNTDSNLYCKFSEQEYFSNLNIEKDFFEYEQNSATVSVKGRLKKSKKYWKDTLKANDTILETIESGYRIPFLYTPKKPVLETIYLLCVIKNL